MKKILMLGGSMQQIPAIKRAKELGFYVITCDYLPNNPGHKFADEWYNVSTTDLDGVLTLAKNLDIDGVVAYASDPAAPTAAYVSEKMNRFIFLPKRINSGSFWLKMDFVALKPMAIQTMRMLCRR